MLERLDLRPESVSTQVVPRDRHAELLSRGGPRRARVSSASRTEVRHLQRTEVREVEEPFRAGAQKGSSAMPHKRNPIVSERVTGIARLLRGYAQAGLENVALWHERDISHSSVERVALPDATTLLDYAQHLATRVADGHGGGRRSHGGQPRAHPRRALLAASAARPGGVRAVARRRLPGGAGGGAARVRAAGRTCGSCWPRRRPSWIWTPCSTPARSCATPATWWHAWTTWTRVPWPRPIDAMG